MKAFLENLSLAQRYALFLFGVIAALLVGSHFIISTVVDNGLRKLYTQRLERSRQVMSHYASVHFLRRADEIEAVVSSPRFVAAVKSGETAQIAVEAPHYKRTLQATVFIVESADSLKTRIIYGLLGPDQPDGFDRLAMSEISRILQEEGSSPQPHYVLNGEDLLELYAVDILSEDGQRIGRLMVGDRVSNFMSSDLERLTGFDVLVRYDGKIVANTESQLANDFICDEMCLQMTAESEGVLSMDFMDQEILSLTMHDEYLNASVTFFGPLSASISPIMSQIRWFLAGLFLLGGVLTMAAMHVFTSRRIGRQVKSLVNAAERIAAGKLDFKITPQSKDELGSLTVMIEKMRAALQKNVLELEEAHQQRLNSERLAAVGKSATGIIHDFKGPMAVIRGSMELMQIRHRDDEKVFQQSQNVVEQIDRMNELAQEVLEFSRGKFELKFQEVNFREFLEYVCQGHEAGFDQAGVSLKLEMEQTSQVRIDPVRFRRVIDNLLNNAREALAPGNCVTVSVHSVATGLALEIADNGPGIPEKLMDTLFEPFVTEGKESGTGLGLSIAQKIIESHNFTIEVSSPIGEGAVFSIAIPETMISALDTSASLASEESS